MDTILIAGLGNPGPQYRGTWHNLGYRAVEKLAAYFSLDFRPGKGQYLLAEKHYAGRDIILLKPTCYMNLSGLPILQVVEKEDLFHENILIICDDINLPLGKLRLRAKGSDGGQKGLASVIYYLGTDDVPRLRLGISTAREDLELKDYVLSEIREKYILAVEDMLNRALDAALCFITEGLNQAMTRFNAPLAEVENEEK